jgi:hypothetical protein
MRPLQPYQAPEAEPSEPAGWLHEQAPRSSGAEESVGAALDAVTLHPIADVCVLQGYPTLNVGNTTDMWVGYDHCSVEAEIARSLVQFDTSSIPPGSSISAATLHIHLLNSCDVGERTHTVTAYNVDGSWSEMSVTWRNQPDSGTEYGSVRVPSRTWGWYTLDVTDLVQGWVNDTITNHGLMLRGPESSGDTSARLGFGTREGLYESKLVVEGRTVSVAISGNQLCPQRTTGVERCFDIVTASPMQATVRFYFREAERQGLPLAGLSAYHYEGAWAEEPGPYTRGGSGNAQYVEAQNVDGFSLFALDGPAGGQAAIYLPLVAKNR